MLTQTNEDIRKLEIVPGVTVGDFGCLLVSVFNAGREWGHFDSEDDFFCFLNILKRNRGFTSNGCLIWGVVERTLQCQYAKYRADDPPVFSNDPDKFWIAELIHYADPRASHFCNVVAVKGERVTYFDVYDGKGKVIPLGLTRSIRQLTFQEAI